MHALSCGMSSPIAEVPIMLPSHVHQFSSERALSFAARFNRARVVLAHAVSAVTARCSLLLQQASDNSPPFR
jgi:hypothetical protein